MCSPHRFFSLSLAAATALAVTACGGGSSGPGRTITGVAGDGQTGPLGGQLLAPLSFVIVGGGGAPVSGAQVAWSATPAGAATFTPATSTTDASGVASTVVTLGTHEGAIEMRATAGGLAPVTFTATAVHPCAFAVPYAIGATTTGALAATDCSVGGYYTDFYGPVTAAAQQGWMVQMVAPFNTWIDVIRGGAPAELFASNGSGSTASSVRMIVAPGAYTFGPSSFSPGATGSYTLSSATRPQTLAGCAPVFITRGVTISDHVVVGECPDSSAAGVFYGETAGMFVAAGRAVTARLSSTAFDPFLVVMKLINNELVVVAANDDSAAGHATAFVQYTAPENTLIVLYASTAVERASGPYTLSVEAPTTSPTAALPMAPYRRLPLPLPPGIRSH